MRLLILKRRRIATRDTSTWEGEKITINFSGPEEIVSKITAAFQL